MKGLTDVAEVERRYTPVPVEARQADGRRMIGGYASVFDKLSRNLGGFVERVAPGAFNESRMAGWPGVIARYNHDDMMLLGTSAAGTLRLGVDGTGLTYEVEPPASRADVLDLVARGDIRSSSFAFRVPANGDEWSTTEQGYPMRTLQAVKLVDVAPVVTPAYPDATAGLRSLAAHVDADVEEVRSMAERDELRRFFVRTDTDSTKTPAKRTFGAAAAMALLARREDPYT